LTSLCIVGICGVVLLLVLWAVAQVDHLIILITLLLCLLLPVVPMLLAQLLLLLLLARRRKGQLSLPEALGWRGKPTKPSTCCCCCAAWLPACSLLICVTVRIIQNSPVPLPRAFTRAEHNSSVITVIKPCCCCCCCW
jgi:hypothetical protein